MKKSKILTRQAKRTLKRVLRNKIRSMRAKKMTMNLAKTVAILGLRISLAKMSD